MDILEKAEDVGKEGFSGDESKALTDWANEPTVADLKMDLTDAKSDVDDHISKVDTWLENLNITGQAVVNNGKTRSSIVPKLIRKQAEWRYASLSEPFLSTADVFNVDPVTYEDKQAAYQNALILNNQFNTKIDKVRFIDEYIRTAVDEGTVIVRTGWEFEEGEVEEEVADWDYEVTEDPKQAQEVMQQVQQFQENPQMLEELPEEMKRAVELTQENGMPIVPVQVGSHMETRNRTIKNHPTVEICNYKNIVIDPTCMGDLDKASFMSYSFESSKAELKRDGKYSNLDKIVVDANSVLATPDHQTNDESNFAFRDEPRKKVVVYEYWGYWDIDGEGVVVPVVAAWIGDTMIRLDKNPFPDKKIPFVTAQYLPVRRSIYGEPDGELLEDNQKIVGAVTRGMIDIMGRSANGQQGVRKDALDVTNKRKFDNGDDYEFNSGMNAKDAFYMHTYPEIPQSAQFMLGMQNNEAESLTGVKAFSGPSGLTGQALGDSVGGIKSAMDAASKRELGILRRLSAGINEIGRKIIAMNGAWLEEDEVVRITNEEFVPISKDDLEGNFDLRLSISTPEADEAKAKELAFMLQTTGQTMGPEFSQIILSDIAKLRKMPELAAKIKDFAPQPNPIEQKKAELEVALLEAQIETEKSKARENNAEAGLDEAKTSNINSDTDLKDLDFLEQESGTKQERDLQKQDRGAQANMDSKLVDHELNKDIKREEAKFAGNTSSNSQ